jgi:hypothetical protein
MATGRGSAIAVWRCKPGGSGTDYPPVTVEGNVLTFLGAGGTLVEAMLGPPWYWSENGIPLNPGDQIELEGFESPDHMEVNWLVKLSTGQTVHLRNEEGIPVWSNGGNDPATTP